jgi:transcriptional antiterminator
MAQKDFNNQIVKQWLTQKQQSDIVSQVNIISDKVTPMVIESARNNNILVTRQSINIWLFNDWPLQLSKGQ